MPDSRQTNGLRGFFIYQDDRHRTVYANPILKKNYLINKSEERTFTAFSMRLSVSILIGVLLGYVLQNYAIGAVAGILVFAVWTIYFWFVYLPKLPEVRNFKKPEGSGVLASIETMENWRIALIAVLTIVISVLSYVNLKQKNYEGFTLYGNYAVCIVCAVYSLINIFVLIRKLIKK